MGALENAKKLSAKEVLDRIEKGELTQTGILREKVAKCLLSAVEESKEEQKELGIVCALNNADIDGVFLTILKKEFNKVMEGMEIAAYAIGAKKKVLCIPEYAKELYENIYKEAGKYDIIIEEGIVNVRVHKGSAFLHIATAKDLADIFEGTYEAGIYVSTDGKELKKIPYDTKVSTLIDLKDAKAILSGYHFYPLEAANLSISEVYPENGVLRAVKKTECIVAHTYEKLTNARKQSCGKCVFCREGLIQLQYMQKEVISGRGKVEYLDYIKEIGEAMCHSTPCTMGQVSAILSLSALREYEAVYKAHLKKKCDVCFNEEVLYIDPKLCQGCGECADICPQNCIEGKVKYIHMIDEFDCDKCGKCMEACENGAIKKTSGKLPRLPKRLTKVGKFRR